jgi:hypothetical protein
MPWRCKIAMWQRTNMEGVIRPSLKNWAAVVWSREDNFFGIRARYKIPNSFEKCSHVLRLREMHIGLISTSLEHSYPSLSNGVSKGYWSPETKRRGQPRPPNGNLLRRGPMAYMASIGRPWPTGAMLGALDTSRCRSNVGYWHSGSTHVTGPTPFQRPHHISSCSRPLPPYEIATTTFA